MSRRIGIGVALTLLLTGCASTWQVTYASAAATADYVERVHERGWSAPLRVRVEECAESLPSTATGEAVDLCLGPYASNDKVVKALEVYNAAADVLAATLLATDPKGDQTPVLAAWLDVLAAARELVSLFPEGDKLMRQLDAIAKRRR
jgi:hypothetical protein